MQKCFYKPTRSHARVFTTTDAARVMCYGYRSALLGGGEEVQGNAVSSSFDIYAQNVVRIARVNCGGGAANPLEAEAARQAAGAEIDDTGQLTNAMDQMVANSALFLQMLEWFGALITFLTVLASVARVVPIPAVRLVAVGAGRIMTRVTAFQGAIIARKAANDVSMTQLETILRVRQLLKAA